MISAEVTMIPQNYVELTDETDIKNLQKTLVQYIPSETDQCL